MVSIYDTPQHIHRSIEAGALGYILKDTISYDLVRTVRTIHQGKRYFSASIANLYIQQQRIGALWGIVIITYK